jgi:hypothetical protein
LKISEEEKMKKLIGIFAVILVSLAIVEVTFAKPIRGKKFEFSTSASMWNVKLKDGETETLINLPIRLGFFIFKGLEIEPELFLTIPEDEGLGYLLLANFSYNFKVSEKIIPFILGGAGYGNSEQSFSLAFDYDTNIFALNFGAGIKYLVGNSAAIRIEYRFIKYSGKYDWFDRTDNNIFVGLSIFF